MDEKIKKLCDEFIGNIIPLEHREAMLDVGFIYLLDGEYFLDHLHDEVCHSSLMDYCLDENIEDAYILSSYINLSGDSQHICNNDRSDFGDAESEASYAYVNWLINDSPFKHCILNDNASDIIEGRVPYVVDSKFQKNYVAAACFAGRLPYEFSNRCEAWYDIVNSGVDPLYAFCLIPFCEKSGDIISIVYNQYHQVFSCTEVYVGYTYLYFKYLLDNPVTKNSWLECRDYNSVNTIWESWDIPDIRLNIDVQDLLDPTTLFNDFLCEGILFPMNPLIENFFMDDEKVLDLSEKSVKKLMDNLKEVNQHIDSQKEELKVA